jgi:hypothetical protein
VIQKKMMKLTGRYSEAEISLLRFLAGYYLLWSAGFVAQIKYKMTESESKK